MRVPRTLPLVYPSLVSEDEEIDRPTPREVFDDLDWADFATYTLPRGTIVSKARGELRGYAVARTGRLSPFRILSRDEALEWITRMLTPHTSSRGWRLRVAIHSLRTARQTLDADDLALERAIELTPRDRRKRERKKKEVAALLEASRRRSRDVAHALYLVRYLLKQRARIRRNRDRQLAFSFAA